MRTLLSLFITVTLLSGRLYAQEPSIPALAAGDKAPDLDLHFTGAYPKEHARLSDFSGKLIILDFWGIYCGTCIEAFPEMKALQKEFAGKIQVILVNEEDKRLVSHRTDSLVRNTGLPYIMGDTVLEKYFPHHIVPHHVWIDGNGVVRAITNYYNSNSAQIRALLEGKPVTVFTKRPTDHFKEGDPLMNLLSSHSFPGYYYSILLPQLPDLTGSGKPWRDSVTGRIYRHTFYHYTILGLFRACLDIPYPDYPFYKRNRIAVEMNTKREVYEPKDLTKLDEWNKENVFNYEIQVADSLSDSLYTMMYADLSRLFRTLKGVSARVEKRMKPCLVLTMTDSTKLISHGGRSMNEQTDSTVRSQNYPLSVVTNFWAMRLQDLPQPFIDKTGYRGNVDLQINANPHSLAAFKKALERCGLKLEEKMEPVDMLVITDH